MTEPMTKTISVTNAAASSGELAQDGARREAVAGQFGGARRTLCASEDRPPLPPFILETAIQKVRLAEDSWNTRDPKKVARGYSMDSRWRNRAEFVTGRAAIIEFLRRKWAKEIEYRLIKELWAFTGNHIAVRFAYEWHDDSGNWFRSYGNENWEYDEHGLNRCATPASTISRFLGTSASSIGRWGAGPTIIPA